MTEPNYCCNRDEMKYNNSFFFTHAGRDEEMKKKKNPSGFLFRHNTTTLKSSFWRKFEIIKKIFIWFRESSEHTRDEIWQWHNYQCNPVWRYTNLSCVISSQHPKTLKIFIPTCVEFIYSKNSESWIEEFASVDSFLKHTNPSLAE